MVKLNDIKTLDVANFLIDLKNKKDVSKKKYKCKLCKYNSSNKQYFKYHMMKHNKIYPYKCTKCDYKTVRKYDFQRHKIIHYDGKKVNCKLCDYKTRHPFYLKNHMKRIHKITCIDSNIQL
jgi:hypothetical protein